MSAPCFYCGEVMNGRRRHVNGVQEPNHPRHETDDHVIPQWILRGMDYERRGKLNPLNLVKCCHACNSYKGNLSPLDWLVIMPSNEGATRLGNLLMQMGCTIDEVSEAMGRRKK